MVAHQPSPALGRFILALADDEFVLGHRDSEWTGHGPILEEDIAFSNIAQDEIGHSLVWYSLYHDLGGPDPDRLAFARPWNEFTCCHFVEYPRNDFAYTVVRQFLFDIAEEVRLRDLLRSAFGPLSGAAERMIKEESYHRLHLQSLVGRLGAATAESSQRMQAALDVAFPQALGIFEPIEGEQELIADGIFSGNPALMNRWRETVMPILNSATLKLSEGAASGTTVPNSTTGYGGRKKMHTPHLKDLVGDLQRVFSTAPEAHW